MGALAGAVLILQPLFFYRRHLFRLTAHIPFDIGDYHLPLTAFIERSVTHWEWPFWNPELYSGFPTHADITAGLFYPFTWFAILADLATGGGRLFYWLEWLVPMHMIVAGIGTYLFFKELRCSPLVALFGATIFQIGPFFVSQAQHLGAICTAAWFPLILLCLWRLRDGFRFRPAAGLAVSICLTILSGFPAAMIVALVLASFFCLGLLANRLANLSLLASFAAASAVGSAMSAIQLVPSMQLSKLSVSSLRYRWMSDGGGMHWQSLVSFVWPNYYGIFSAWDRSRYQLPFEFNSMYTFCGYAAVVLIPLAVFFVRRMKLLPMMVTLLVVSAIWMLGENTPVYPSVFRHLPHFLQNPLYAELALVGFSLFAAGTATLVLSALELRVPLYLVLLIAGLNSWNLIRTGSNRVFNTFEGDYKVAMTSWSDGASKMPDVLQQLVGTSEPRLRIDFLSEAAKLVQTAPGVFDIPSAAGDNPFLLLRYYDLRHLFSDSPGWSRRQFPRDLNSPWFQALNIGYVLEDAAAAERPIDEDRYERLPFTSVRMYRVKNPLPRFYVVNRIIKVADETQALAEIQQSGFDPVRNAIVQDAPNGWTPQESAYGTVNVLRYENNRVDLDVQTSGTALLVTSEPLYPGWTVTVNGVATSILPTNVAFRGIPLNAGANHIAMRYFPEGFILALAVTLVACALVLCGILVTRSKPSLLAQQS